MSTSVDSTATWPSDESTYDMKHIKVMEPANEAVAEWSHELLMISQDLSALWKLEEDRRAVGTSAAVADLRSAAEERSGLQDRLLHR